jgi:hypothetical protein
MLGGCGSGEGGMFDARPGHGTPIDRGKLLSLQVTRGGRPRETRVTEGRAHPETGRPWKTVSTEAGSTTEHATHDDRVDAVARVQTIRAVRDPATGKVSNV